MIYRDHITLTGNDGAVFSDCLKYRYRLWRVWDRDLPRINFLMLNPSTADDVSLDPTITRCKVRATRLGYGGLAITNLFAYRATDPRDMKRQADPVGPDNDEQIMLEAKQADTVVLGWGEHGKHLNRAAHVVAMLKAAIHPNRLRVLHINSSGEPGHPLYLAYGISLSRFFEHSGAMP